MILAPMESIAIIAVVAICTFVLRISPFVLFGGKEPSPIILYLGRVLPAAIMALLVVYCFKSLRFDAVVNFLPMILSGLLVAGLHAWKGKSLLSIIAGTACYMLLVQVIFV